MNTILSRHISHALGHYNRINLFFKGRSPMQNNTMSIPRLLSLQHLHSHMNSRQQIDRRNINLTTRSHNNNLELRAMLLSISLKLTLHLANVATILSVKRLRHNLLRHRNLTAYIVSKSP